jgi:hypothetical protein
MHVARRTFGQVIRGAAAGAGTRHPEPPDLSGSGSLLTNSSRSSFSFSTDESQLTGQLDSSSRRSSIFTLAEDSAHVRVCVRVRPMRGQARATSSGARHLLVRAQAGNVRRRMCR